MAPEIFIKAYTATSEEYQLSEEAPRIDAKNPAGDDEVEQINYLFGKEQLVFFVQ